MKSTVSYFKDCLINNFTPRIINAESNYPKLYFSNDKFIFDNCTIYDIKLSPYNSENDKLNRQILKGLYFIDSEIQNLTITGKMNDLSFKNSTIKNFESSQIKSITNNFEIVNTSIESTLNLANLTFSDSSKFQFINSSYQGYMKVPWKEIKGKIHLDIKEIKLKHYASFYNLITQSYKYLSFIDEADKSYFYWKEYERENYWEYFWAEESTHWYNPADVITALWYSVFNFVNYYSCGYGVKPLWIFSFTGIIVLLIATVYFFVPTRISNLADHLMAKNKIMSHLRDFDKDNLKQLFGKDDFDFNQPKMSIIEDIGSAISTDELLERLSLVPKSRYNFTFYWHCIYFSFSTFTTIGIGDWYPTGKLNKALVMLEGAIGWLCLGLFITTYANILLR